MSEKLRKGPSMLDELLLLRKDPETGHILIRPEEARSILLEVLYAFHVRQQGVPDTRIEALHEIGMEKQDVKIDFTDKLKALEGEREKAWKEAHKFDAWLNVIRPSRPSPRKPII